MCRGARAVAPRRRRRFPQLSSPSMPPCVFPFAVAQSPRAQYFSHLSHQSKAAPRLLPSSARQALQRFLCAMSAGGPCQA
eukprot:15148313-Alexandrium_andersonii.AAC.1